MSQILMHHLAKVIVLTHQLVMLCMRHQKKKKNEPNSTSSSSPENICRVSWVAWESLGDKESDSFWIRCTGTQVQLVGRQQVCTHLLQEYWYWWAKFRKLCIKEHFFFAKIICQLRIMNKLKKYCYWINIFLMYLKHLWS